MSPSSPCPKTQASTGCCAHPSAAAPASCSPSACTPLHAASFTPADLARFLRLLPDAPWIGEIGLALSPAGRPSRRAQLRIFEAILSEPRATALPLTIHSRGAELETIERLAQAGAPRAILHWSTGPLRLETDGPFTRHNSKPSRPSDLPDLLPRLAALWSTDEYGARNQLNANQTVFLSPPTAS
ncbi:TatD family hydrolase [Streptomyces xanthochromogenes]|uniref:TatD family hydrolase n=1 Tax=Streptomyces xanthochromogenes TaxID=67384 RepID=UPI003424A0BC